MRRFVPFWQQRATQCSGPFSVLAGISSSGKSTFLDAHPSQEHRFAHQVSSLGDIPDQAILHYNTLRYAKGDPDKLAGDFAQDPVFAMLLNSNRPFATQFVFCSRDDLLARIKIRQSIEANQGCYPHAQFRALVEALDYPDFQKRWVDRFREVSGSVILLHAVDDRFDAVSTERFEKIIAQ